MRVKFITGYRTILEERFNLLAEEIEKEGLLYKKKKNVKIKKHSDENTITL